MIVSPSMPVMTKTGALHISIRGGLMEIWTMGPGIWYDTRGTHFRKLSGPCVISERKNFISIKGDYMKILDTKGIMDLLHISINSVYKMYKDPDCPTFKVNGEYRIIEEELIKYLKEKSVNTVDKRKRKTG